jgi:DNA repair protein RecN (Recombination protein N)
MLKKIRISNYALIEDLEITFNDGMTSITGETGAGKSIILGGLSLVLGSRVDNSKIINKENKCFVEAVFDISDHNLESFFTKYDLDFDDQTILRREISPLGKSRAFINDTPVKIELLSILSKNLIDIHSQFDNLEILNSKFIFLILDSLSGISDLSNNFIKKFKLLQSIENKIEEKLILKKKLDSDQDYNKYLLEEFNNLEIEKLNFSELKTKVKEAENLDSIKETLSLINNEFNTEQVGIIDKLSSIVRSLNKVSNSSDRLEKLSDKLNSILENINEVILDSESIYVDINLSDENIEDLTDNLDKINTLFNKHRVNSIEELIEIKEELSKNLNDQNKIESDISLLQKEKEKMLINLTSEADIIHEKRKNVKVNFEDLLNSCLLDLGMNNSQLKINLERTQNLQKYGFSIGQFLLKSSKNNEYSDIREIASGGEISRVMLAIKSIISNHTKLSSIIFDEIDTGISGSISSKVGDLMYKMSKKMQVIVITHTAQVASKGDFHFKVFKKEFNNRVVTDVKILNDKERVNEIAEMLSGDKLNKSANELANELLN